MATFSAAKMVAQFIAECTPEEGAAAFKSKDNPTGMFTRVEVITPERAARDLSRVPPGIQRPIRTWRVQVYSEQRAADKWRLHHQGVAYDCDGILRDGQHRLTMVVQSNQPTPMLVAYNVPVDGLMHADEQMPRSIRDALKMAAKGSYSLSIISTSRAFASYPTFLSSRTAWDREVVLDLLRKHSDALDYSERWLSGVKLITRGVRAVVSRAWYHIDEGRLDQFCEVLRTGMPISENRQEDSAAIVYSRVIASGGSARSNETRERELYMKGQMAIQHFVDRSSIDRLYGTDKDLFPLPKE